MQSEISDKHIDEINAQMKKYYANAMKRTIADFEATYDKILATKKKGEKVTPADLYNLDKYWKMQGQLKQELELLGEKEITLLSEKFEEQYRDIYKSTTLRSKSSGNFAEISDASVKEMINSCWCADGKTWSDRVWDNTEKLAETLNEELVHCVVTGKKTTELKNLLQERFNVSYRQAETLVRTEIAQLQISASRNRYESYGLKEYEILGRDEHDIGCVCKKMNGKKFKLSEMKIGINAPPFHPRCRCDIIPVVDTDFKDKIITNKKDKENKEQQINNIKAGKCLQCGKDFASVNGAVICNKCRNEVLNRQGAITLRTRGYTDDEIVKWFIAPDGKEEKDAFDEMWYKRRNLYEEWKLKHPNESLEKHGYYFKSGYGYRDGFKKEWYRKSDDKYIDESDLFFVCVDCGEIFLRNSNSQKRCADCEAIHRRKYKAAKEKERRLKKKLNGK